MLIQNETTAKPKRIGEIMNPKIRREQILNILKKSQIAVSGENISKAIGVSRQIVVQDIAELRREGFPITSTYRGYCLNVPVTFSRTIKMHHTNEQTEDELYTIVDLGGAVVDVSVNHRVYGKLTAPLDIKSREDVSAFMNDIRTGKSVPLMNVTSCYHYHLIRAESEEILDRIEALLRAKGYTAQLLPYEKA